jgi:hypothetical protein
MENNFLPYKESLILKELGFDEPCLAHLIGFGDGSKENGRYKINQHEVFYPNDFVKSDDKAEELGLYPFSMCGVPLYQQTLKWFRDFYNLFGVINVDQTMEPKFCYSIYEYEPTQFFQGWDEIVFNSDLYYTYEEAELECIRKLIEIVKKQKI